MTLTALGMPALRSRTNGIADPRVVPTTGPLVDTFGRVAQRSAGVANRPLQPAVQLLHA